MAGEEWIKTIQERAKEQGAPVATYDAAWIARCVENAILNYDRDYEDDTEQYVNVAEDGSIEVIVKSTFLLTLSVAPDTGAITGRIEA